MSIPAFVLILYFFWIQTAVICIHIIQTAEGESVKFFYILQLIFMFKIHIIGTVIFGFEQV